MTYNELREEMQRGIELIDGLDKKWVKANSKRLRDILNTIKKNATAIKKQLIEDDKE